MKLCLLGDGRVGKTSLRRQYLGQGFATDYLETLGADFAFKVGNVAGYEFRYQIWDIAGQPRYSELKKSFYMGAQAALVLYDITNNQSYANVRNWVEELWRYNTKGKTVPVVIVGNKVDLRPTFDNALRAQAGEQLVKELVEENSLDFEVPFLETSAKTGEQVEEAFDLISRIFLRIHDIRQA